MSNERQTPQQIRVSGDPAFRLVTLGSCRLEGPTGSLPGGLGSGRPLAILAYLALHPQRSVSRDELADLLWSDRDLKAARRVLRQALYVIRKGLGEEALESDGDLVRFAGAIRLDVVEFEEAVRRGDHDEALAVYGGPFLDGFQLSSAGQFAHWVDRERERLRRMYREVTIERAAIATAAGSWSDALSFLDRALVFAPEDLEFRSRRIEVLDLAGRHAEAVAEAAAVLQTAERDQLPLPDWAQAVLARTTEGHTPTPIEQPDAGYGLASPAFVGRGTELRTLLDQWHQATACQGKVALVVGDPGIGKTRLIEELVRVAELEGATILGGKSYELEDGLLFGALVDVMAQSIRAPGFAAVSNVWLTELTRLLPELQDHYPQIEAGGDVESGPGRRRFHEAVAQVFSALAFEAPVVCVLDDLHWADDATLELVHYLARRLCAAPVLIVAGLRPREASPTLRRLQHVLEEEHGGTCIDLGPLDRDAIGQILKSMAHGHDAPDNVVDSVWESAGGNPFLAVSTVRALVESGAVRVDADGWEVPTEGRGKLPEPWVLIRSRLEDLPRRTHEILQLAAIVGRSFGARMLAEASGEDPDSALVHLEVLEQRRILKVDRTNGTVTFDFTHDRLREAVYEGIPSERKAELHARAARALAGSAGLNACILARHLHEAGQRDEAFRHALAGAEWARGVFAYAGEVEMLELALENAPGTAELAEVEERLRSLLATQASPAGGSPEPRILSAWRGTTGVAATVVLALAGWWGFTASARATAIPILPPLPEGVLVWVDQGDSSAFGIVDPSRPRQRPRMLRPEEFNLPETAIPSSVRLSPDLAFVAFDVDEGRAPDVFMQRRDGLGLVHVTTDPEDDTMRDWLPDGSGLLFSTFREGIRPDYGRSLAIRRLDGSPVRVVTSGPWMDNDASFSPDGSRLLVVRQLGDYSIWVMDQDGSDGRPLIEGLGQTGRARWSPDGRHVTFSESLSEGRRIRIFNMDDPEGSLATLVSGTSSGFAWSPDGSHIFFSKSVNGNLEIHSVPRAGGEPVRLTFTRANEFVVSFPTIGSPPAEKVEIPNVGPSGIHLLTGGTLSLIPVVWSADGGLVETVGMELRCLDAAVCRVDDDTTVTATGPGTTHVIADLGGWRADTARVRVSSGEPQLLLEEGWESGIDPARWNSVGFPAPRVMPGLGRGGSRGFVNGGDDKYSSGVASVAGFDWTEGLTVESWGRGDFDYPEWPSSHSLGLGLSHSPHPADEGDSSLRKAVEISIGKDSESAPVELVFQGLPLAPSDTWDPGEWHHYAIQFHPTGICEAWIDGQMLTRDYCSLPPTDTMWVVLAGRASDAPVVHDDLKVWKGLRWR